MSDQKEYIVSSLNPSLAYLFSLRRSFTIIAADGSGDYTTVGAAIAAGATVMYCKPGVITEIGSLNMTGRVLIGAGPGLVSIALPLNSFMYFDRYAADSDAGTATLTADTDAGTNADNSFTGIDNLPAFIASDSILQEVKAIADPATLTLLRMWRGNTAAEAHKIQSVRNQFQLLFGVTIDQPAATAASSVIVDNGIGTQIINCVIQGTQIYSTGISTPEVAGEMSVDAKFSKCTFRNLLRGVRLYGAQNALIETSRFENIYFDAVEVSQGAIANTISRCVFAGARNYAISISGSSIKTRIQNCSFARGRQDDIHIAAGSNETMIDDCVFRLTASASYAVNSAADDTVISRCHFYEIKSAVYCTAARARIAGSLFSTSYADAVQILTTAAEASISGNVLFNSSMGTSIGISATDRAVIDGNSVTGFAYAISAVGGAITGNSISCASAGSWGVRVTGVSPSVTGNIVSVDTRGIDASAGTAVSIVGNRISTAAVAGIGIATSISRSVVSGNSVVSTTAGAASRGIRLTGNDSTVSANAVYGTFEEAIESSSGTRVSITANAVTASTTGIAVSGDDVSISCNFATAPTAIRSTSGSRHSISANTVSASTLFAIRSQANDVSITGNSVSATTGDGIVAAARSVVSGNIVLIVAAGAVGIYVTGAYSTISGNFVRASDANATLVSAAAATNTTISGNALYGALSTVGVSVSGASSNVVVSSNAIAGTVTPIDVTATPTQTSIVGNAIAGGSTYSIDIAGAQSLVSGNRILDSLGSAIRLASTATLSRVEANHIYNFQTTGILVVAVPRAAIGGNYIYSAQATAAYGIRVMTSATEVSILSNVISFGAAAVAALGIATVQGVLSITANDVISAAGSAAIGIDSQSQLARVSGNSVSGFLIALQVAGARSTVSGNHLQSAAAATALACVAGATHCALSANFVRASSALSTAVATQDQTEVSGNVIEAGGTGITTGTSCAISGNWISATVAAISAPSKSDLSISGNVIAHSAGIGISLPGSSMCSVTGNTMNSTGATAAIDATDVSNSVFNANIFLGAGSTYAVYFARTAATPGYNTVSGNFITGFTTGILAAAQTTSLTVSNNQFVSTTTGVSTAAPYSVVSANNFTGATTAVTLAATALQSSIVANRVTASAAGAAAFVSAAASVVVSANSISQSHAVPTQPAITLTHYSTVNSNFISGFSRFFSVGNYASITGNYMDGASTLIGTVGMGAAIQGNIANSLGDGITTAATSVVSGNFFTTAGTGYVLTAGSTNTISGNYFASLDGDCIRLTAVTDTSVSGNYLWSGNANIPLAVSGGSGHQITGNTIVADSGVALSFTTAATGCCASGNTIRSTNSYAIDLDTVTKITISSCAITSTASTGVHIANTTGATLSACTITAATAGVSCDTVAGINISACAITATTAAAVAAVNVCTRINITACNMSSAAGIVVSITSTTDVRISSCEIYAPTVATYAVYFSACTRLTVSHSSILAGAGTVSCLYITGSDSVSITGNIMTTSAAPPNTTYGIQFAGAANAVHHQINGNIIFGPATAIHVHGPVNATGNYIYGHILGVDLPAAATGSILSSNFIYSATAAVVASTYTEISACVFTGAVSPVVTVSGAYAIVSGNTFYALGNGINGLLLSGGAASVSGNYFETDTSTGAARAISITTNPTASLSGNFINTFPLGIYIDVTNVSVSGGAILASASYAIQTTVNAPIVSICGSLLQSTSASALVSAGAYAVITGNIISAPASSGITISASYQTITGNFITASVSSITGAGQSAISVSANFLLNSTAAYCVVLTGNTAPRLNGNTIFANFAGGGGLNLATSTRAVVSSNTFLMIAATGYCVNLDTTINATISGNEFSAGSYAVYAVASDHVSVSSNNARVQSVTSFYFDANCNFCSVTGNTIDTPASNGIDFAGNNSTISANTIDSAGATGINITAAADRIAAHGNISLNCVTANLTNAGSNTDVAHNIIA